MRHEVTTMKNKNGYLILSCIYERERKKKRDGENRELNRNLE